MLNKRIIKNEFETFKDTINNADITIDINDDDHETMPIHIYWKATNLCMYFEYNLEENSFFVHQVKHCGTNIPLLLSFIKQLLDKYGSTYSLMDLSYFYFQNNQTREMVFIRLKDLYTLCYGKTFYTKILSDDPPSEEPTVDVKIFDRIPSFFYEEKDIIETILVNNRDIENIGMFFQFIKDDLKRITVSVNDEYKLVNDIDWKTVKLYSCIITKTYAYLQEYLQNPLLQIEILEPVSPLYPMINTRSILRQLTLRKCKSKGKCKGKLSSTRKQNQTRLK